MSPPKSSAVRLKDIAEKLNISVTTVWRALGTNESDLVAPELRKKIREMASQARYVPHSAARLMRKPNIHLITVLLPLDSAVFLSDYYGTVLSGVISAARDLGMEARVALIGDQESDGDIADHMQRAAIGAGGLFYTAASLDAEDLVKIEVLGRPIVVISGCLPAGVALSSIHVDTVGADNVKGSYDVTKDLLQLGHRRIGFVNGPATSRDACEREAGFLNAMKEHNGIVDPKAMMRGEFSPETGRRGWQQIKRCAPLPTAVMCGNDGIAFGVLESLAQDKVNCPGQISVVGFDDSPAAVHVIPKLTTVRQPIAELGRAATELLNRRLQSPDESTVEHLVFPMEVIHRQSTAPPGNRSRPPALEWLRRYFHRDNAVRRNHRREPVDGFTRIVFCP